MSACQWWIHRIVASLVADCHPCGEHHRRWEWEPLQWYDRRMLSISTRCSGFGVLRLSWPGAKSWRLSFGKNWAVWRTSYRLSSFTRKKEEIKEGGPLCTLSVWSIGLRPQRSQTFFLSVPNDVLAFAILKVRLHRTLTKCYQMKRLTLKCQKLRMSR